MSQHTETIVNALNNLKPTRLNWVNSRAAIVGMGGLIGLNLVSGFWFDQVPERVTPTQMVELTHQGAPSKPGSVTTAALMLVTQTLLDKPGGYLSNDIMPPGVLMDNMPNFEWGALVQSRDLARSLRKDFSRSQSQSTENPHLVVAEPALNYDSEKWFPSAENSYRKAQEALGLYLGELLDPTQPDSQFFARADNLGAWLSDVETRLGSLSQRLSASVGQVRINTDLSGDAAAEQSTPAPANQMVKTPWSEVDDVFYEARGSAWALIQFLRAVEVDFQGVLQDKNATASLKQITRELEATQASVWSPVILNGSGFGLFANHSLVMASYISRAHSAITDLRTLLSEG